MKFDWNKLHLKKSTKYAKIVFQRNAANTKQYT